MAIRTFGSFNFEEVQDLFNIKRNDEIPLMTQWLSANYQSNNLEVEILNWLKKHLFQQVLAWNEDELKMFFIGPLIEFADLVTDDFKPFTQRMLAATINEMEINGRVDFMIAKGIKTAKPPYFCIHEYTCTERSRSEQETNMSEDPLGQLLIAMVVAQILNENKFPILGAYIVGRNWSFVVLEGNQYTISQQYDAASDDIFQIFAILKKSKDIIQTFISF